jgi:hypothetical protein
MLMGLIIVAMNGCGGGGSGSTTPNITPSQIQQLKKTGLTKSYDEEGNEVTDGSIKDDGYYQKGVAPSYTRDDTKEVVIDNITGLMWQDNDETETVKKNWDDAKTYCQNLSLGEYDDWRLPSIDELMYIADRSKRLPGIDTTYFNHVVQNNYWSSTTVAGSERGAWSVNFDGGYDFVSRKSDSYHWIRCVRPAQ